MFNTPRRMRTPAGPFGWAARQPHEQPLRSNPSIAVPSSQAGNSVLTTCCLLQTSEILSVNPAGLMQKQSSGGNIELQATTVMQTHKQTGREPQAC